MVFFFFLRAPSCLILNGRLLQQTRTDSRAQKKQLVFMRDLSCRCPRLAMFVMHFHRLVRETLDWTEAPGTTYVNKHMSILRKREMQTADYGELGLDNETLRLYISNTYPAYFGLILRIGEYAVKNRHLVTNHPVLHRGRPYQLVS